MCSVPFFSPSSLVANRILVCEIARTSNGLKPSFYELDLCLRALLLDENVGYVPPFIVLFETGKDGERAFLSLFLLLIRVTQVGSYTLHPRVPRPVTLDPGLSAKKHVEAALVPTLSVSDCGMPNICGAFTIRAPWSGMSSALIIASCATFGDAKSKCRRILRQVRCRFRGARSVRRFYIAVGNIRHVVSYSHVRFGTHAHGLPAVIGLAHP